MMCSDVLLSLYHVYVYFWYHKLQHHECTNMKSFRTGFENVFFVFFLFAMVKQYKYISHNSSFTMSTLDVLAITEHASNSSLNFYNMFQTFKITAYQRLTQQKKTTCYSLFNFKQVSAKLSIHVCLPKWDNVTNRTCQRSQSGYIAPKNRKYKPCTVQEKITYFKNLSTSNVDNHAGRLLTKRPPKG